MQISTRVGVVQVMIFLTFFGRIHGVLFQDKTVAQPRHERNRASAIAGTPHAFAACNACIGLTTPRPMMIGRGLTGRDGMIVL